MSSNAVAPSRALGSVRDAAFWRTKGAETAAVTLFYFAVACFMTWPLVTGLGHVIYSVPRGDPLGTVAFYRELVEHGHSPFLPWTNPNFSYPGGQPVPWPRDLAAIGGVGSMWLLSVALGAIAAYGVYVLAGFTLSGVAGYLLARRLTGDRWASLIAGWALAFYPYAIVNGWVHADYIQSWVLVLGLWRMIELMWRPTRRNGLLAGGALIVGMWWTPYFILMGGACFVAAGAAGLVVNWRAGRLRVAVVPYAITTACVLAFAALLGVLSRLGEAGTGGRVNTFSELQTYGARPLEYVLPDKRSPLFGGLTRYYIETHQHGSNEAETTLYLGGTIILLALVALWQLARGQMSRRRAAAAAVIFVTLAVALLTSLPPEAHVLGISIPLPSKLIWHASTDWRVYARLVVLAMVCLSALAAVALAGLSGRHPKYRVAIMLVASVAVPLDLWARIAPPRTLSAAAPALYTRLSRLPHGVVADYPLVPAAADESQDLFYQSAHGMPMINGYLEESAAERRALNVAKLSSPSTAGILASMGVKYVVVRSGPTGHGLPAPGTPGAGFELLDREPYGELYRVTAAPSREALAAVGPGFSGPEPSASGPFYWLLDPEGLIEVAGKCVTCEGVLTLHAESAFQPRTVTIARKNGGVLLRKRLYRNEALRIPLRFSRFVVLKVATEPGPQSIHEATGASDPRSVSIRVMHVNFVAAKP